MKRIPLAVLVLAASFAPVVAVAGPVLPKFSLDPASPSVDANLTPDDVVRPGPTVQTPGTDLGLLDDFFTGVFDNLDALSYGRDPLTGPLYFSVDRVAVGSPGTAVNLEAAPGASGAHGDVFVALPPLLTNLLFIDQQSLGLQPDFFGDDLDALELDSPILPFAYFSIDALSATNAFGAGALAGDVLVSSGNGTFGTFAEGVAHIGLHSDDDLDALVLLDLGVKGRLDPGLDVAWFSLSTFSPSAFTFTGNPYIPGVPGFLSPADVLVTSFTGSFGLLAPAASLGLEADDELDALDTVPEPPHLVTLAIAFWIGARILRRLHGRSRRGRVTAAAPFVIVALLSGSSPAWAAASDMFGTATVIAALPYTDKTDITGFAAALEANEPGGTTAGCANTPRDLIVRYSAWYSYTSPKVQRLIAHTFGSNYNTVIAVYRAGDPDTLANLARIACNDNAQPRTAARSTEEHSQLAFGAEAGIKYYFQVGLVSGRKGLEFRLGVFGNAALLVNGSLVPSYDRTHMELALRRSPLWSHAAVVQLSQPTLAELQAAIRTTYDGVPADAVSLFVFSGHGSKTRGPAPNHRTQGPLVDNAPEDEGGAGNDGADEQISISPGVNVEDDDLSALFVGVTGKRVFVFDACYSGGLVDGTSDFPERPAGLFLLSSEPHQKSSFSTDGVINWRLDTEAKPHAHSWFIGSLITGISRSGAANFAPADGADGTARNGEVTVHEWFTYADDTVRQIRDTWNARHPRIPEEMDPKIEDARAPANGGPRDVVIFTYTPSADKLPDPPLLLHPGPALAEPRRLTVSTLAAEDEPIEGNKCDVCCRDLGDAPDPFDDTPGQYPTRRASDGAVHENTSPDPVCPLCGGSARTTTEWLGARIDDEADADVESDDVDSDADDVDGDADDDGVAFLTTGSALDVAVTVAVQDRAIPAPDGTPAYDSNTPAKRLYLNAWADWDRDGLWLPSEKIIGIAPGDFAIDPRSDPQFADDNRGSFRFSVPIPSTAAAGGIYFRFRLDYGEDVGQLEAVNPTLNEERGVAQFGEVEDYCIALAPLFEGLSPPVVGSDGSLALSRDLAALKVFDWQSTDSVLGTIDLDNVSARTWNYFPGTGGNPSRLVFVGGRNDVTVYGDVLFEPYNRAVVDVVKGTKRIRYLLTSDGCPIPARSLGEQ
jgi:hypothetical protein